MVNQQDTAASSSNDRAFVPSGSSPSVSPVPASIPSAAKIAKKLTPPMRLLLSRHAEGWASSLYPGAPGTDQRLRPFWNSFDCTYAQPHFHVREALISRGLIEPHDDAARITPLGVAVHRAAQAIEARRAETQSGSVHESAVLEEHAPNAQVIP